MIRMRFSLLENIIDFDERFVQVLEFENKDLFKKILYIVNKYCSCNQEGNDIVILEDEKRIEPFKSAIIINDFFNIELNTNKIIKALYNDIELEYNVEYGEDNLILKLEDVLTNVKEILLEYDFEFEFKQELKLSELLKAIGLKFNEYCYDDPYKNLLCLFDLIGMFKICKVLILNNAKIYFSDEEIVELYKTALQRNIKLLLIEYTRESPLLQYENKLHIDNDYDEFIIK